MNEPLKLEVESLADMPAERAALYALDEATNRYRLNTDADPRRLLGALRAERDRGDVAEREAASVKAERDAVIEAANAERDKAQADAAAARALLFDARVTQAATLEGLHPAAVGDALRASREVFRINEAGEIVTRDDSKIDLRQWLLGTRQTSPHWWPISAWGSGAVQSRSSESIHNSVSRSKFDQASPQQRAALLGAGVVVTD